MLRGDGEKRTRLLGKNRVALNPDCVFTPDACEPPRIDEALTKLKNLTGGVHLLRERMKPD